MTSNDIVQVDVNIVRAGMLIGIKPVMSTIQNVLQLVDWSFADIMIISIRTMFIVPRLYVLCKLQTVLILAATADYVVRPVAAPVGAVDW